MKSGDITGNNIIGDKLARKWIFLICIFMVQTLHLNTKGKKIKFIQMKNITITSMIAFRHRILYILVVLKLYYYLSLKIVWEYAL